jgi:hypothetical protein
MRLRSPASGTPQRQIVWSLRTFGTQHKSSIPTKAGRFNSSFRYIPLVERRVIGSRFQLDAPGTEKQPPHKVLLVLFG